MNTLRNKVQLIGNVGNEPEIKNFDGGKKKLGQSDHRYKRCVLQTKKETKSSKTEWHRLTAGGKTAESSKNLS